MTDIVVDASVTVMLLFPEPLSMKAVALFEDADLLGYRLVAPHLLPVEVTNVIRRHMRQEGLPLTQALAQLEDFLSQPIDLLSSPELHRRALTLTEAHSLGAHDANYVALAQLLGCELWTADQRILRAVGGRLSFVRFINDYTSPGDDQ